MLCHVFSCFMYLDVYNTMPYYIISIFLPSFPQCIELYTEEDGKQEVGFYSLEMAPDLELDPKQYHVVAFEDASDCKNVCHIIQSHMDMFEKGNAVVVARRPKVHLLICRNL